MTVPYLENSTLKKGKGAATSKEINFAKSTCANKVNFSYAVACSSTSSSPSSNIPIHCPVRGVLTLERSPAQTQPAESDPASPSSLLQDPPTPEITTSSSQIEPTDDHQFVLDSPVTRIGQKQKTQDLQAILEVCAGGEAMTHKEILSGKSIIRCSRSTGCETGWVSQQIARKQSSRYWKGVWSLTIALVVGPVRHAKQKWWEMQGKATAKVMWFERLIYFLIRKYSPMAVS